MNSLCSTHAWCMLLVVGGGALAGAGTGSFPHIPSHSPTHRHPCLPTLSIADARATRAASTRPVCHYVNQKVATVCMTGELLNDCPQVPVCSTFSCRTDCTPVTGDLPTGAINEGYFNQSDCASAGSTFNLVKCTGCWLGTSCCCSGAVITAGLPCSRYYDSFVYCADE
jgi:hypothetical protein